MTIVASYVHHHRSLLSYYSAISAWLSHANMQCGKIKYRVRFALSLWHFASLGFIRAREVYAVFLALTVIFSNGRDNSTLSALIASYQFSKRHITPARREVWSFSQFPQRWHDSDHDDHRCKRLKSTFGRWIFASSASSSSSHWKRCFASLTSRVQCRYWYWFDIECSTKFCYLSLHFAQLLTRFLAVSVSSNDIESKK